MTITSWKHIPADKFNSYSLVSHFDLVPTILNWFEIDTNTNHFGHSLLCEIQGRKKLVSDKVV